MAKFGNPESALVILNGNLSADHVSNFAAGPLDEFTILFTYPVNGRVRADCEACHARS